MEIQYTELIHKIKTKDCFQIQINTQFLNANFQLIKQCLKKISSLKNNIDDQNKITNDTNDRLTLLFKQIANIKLKQQSNEKKFQSIEKKQELIEKKIRELGISAQSYQINQSMTKTDEIIKQIRESEVFVTGNQFKEFKNQACTDIQKMKQNLDRFVQKNVFDQFEYHNKLSQDRINHEIELIRGQVNNLNSKCDNTNKKIEQMKSESSSYSNLIKQINNKDIDGKMKKFKQDINSNIMEMNKKIKKMLVSSSFGQIQQNIVQKIDYYFANICNKFANKQQTKKALVFLQTRINYLVCVHIPDEKQQGTQSLFATRNWMCAACSTNLGKYQGKLNKFKPWAIFPCRQLSPQKVGGYGYLSYLQKVSVNKGVSLEQNNLQRLNQTNISMRKSGKLNATKTTNFMSNYGENLEIYPKLRNEYYKTQEKMKTNESQEQISKRLKSSGKTQRTFRRKKQKTQTQIDLSKYI